MTSTSAEIATLAATTDEPPVPTAPVDPTTASEPRPVQHHGGPRPGPDYYPAQHLHRPRPRHRSAAPTGPTRRHRRAPSTADPRDRPIDRDHRGGPQRRSALRTRRRRSVGTGRQQCTQLHRQQHRRRAVRRDAPPLHAARWSSTWSASPSTGRWSARRSTDCALPPLEARRHGERHVEVRAATERAGRRGADRRRRVGRGLATGAARRPPPPPTDPGTDRRADQPPTTPLTRPERRQFGMHARIVSLTQPLGRSRGRVSRSAAFWTGR